MNIISAEEFLRKVKFDHKGLIPVIAQCIQSDQVLMLAYMSRDSLQQTLKTGLVCYWSRSRSSLWTKGQTSGNLQHLCEIYLDCDGDSILMKILQDGPACHTGEPSCFFCQVDGNDYVRAQLAQEAVLPPTVATEASPAISAEYKPGTGMLHEFIQQAEQQQQPKSSINIARSHIDPDESMY